MTPSTSHPEFNSRTEGLEVAKAFGSNVKGRTILITGVNKGGIGYAIAQAFASQSPAHLILAGRTPAKLQECGDLLRAAHPGVDVRALRLDLSSAAAVRRAAAELLAWDDVPAVDVVVNNAAVALLPERAMSAEYGDGGVEMHLATNHLGHFLFVAAIMPKLLRAAEGSSAVRGATRVVNVSALSPKHGAMRWSDINFEKVNKTLPEDEQPEYQIAEAFGYKNVQDMSYFGLGGYSQSKVANVLHAVALTARLFEKHGILAVAVHPGIAETELARSFPPENAAALEGVFPHQTVASCAATPLVAALDPRLAALEGGGRREARAGRENYGVYLVDCQICGEARPAAVSSAEAERLWKWSEEMVKEEFSW
ncbi:NAD(P)-binding protein [Xylariaceae sp. FL0804]|nr:NAD(P)-binding protein [Xylariaceae sp. FL0804]